MLEAELLSQEVYQKNISLVNLWQWWEQSVEKNEEEEETLTFLQGE